MDILLVILTGLIAGALAGRVVRACKTISGRVMVGGQDGWCSSSRRETDAA